MREDTDARLRRIRPWRIDYRARLDFDHRVRLALEPVNIGGADDAFLLQPSRVQGDRIARPPILVELAIRVALARRRIVPRRLRIAAEIQHVVVVRVAAHPHRNQLDERRA